MPSEDPSDKIIEDVAKGATKGFLEYSKEQIISLVKKLRDKKLAFIKEEKTIEVAREQYRSGESKFYHNYIKDKELLFLIGMGLTLRKVEDDYEKRQNLRNKIFQKHKLKGLHIAEFVQNGILNRYIGILLEVVQSIGDLEKQIEEVLKDVDKHALFVQSTDKLGDVIRKSIILTDSHSPNIFVISGEGIAAEMLRKDIDKIKESLKKYSLERISTERHETLFFKLITEI